ncbi:hypothetical protein F4780DRAFT_304572 [Xylariomycetidae sp. FL0641]|nr:hypothetical protein F4780DRAFT_304572 [Xylariomycetidae sp. FL0641]
MLVELPYSCIAYFITWAFPPLAPCEVMTPVIYLPRITRDLRLFLVVVKSSGRKRSCVQIYLARCCRESGDNCSRVTPRQVIDRLCESLHLEHLAWQATDLGPARC